ncbi:M48 family metallopeptidase [Candidatus Ruthia endofausta]|uniref:M48 family metallopeptidase n=1 Tax=Candidatus Ruthia endofausta TaxID=2738852 RepID=A0A6N0HNJ9_9GAMM|nr:M48 family metallopeptidase [Candidatus Ruthia endofausta]
MNYNIMAPMSVIDYVIVHELAPYQTQAPSK